MIELPEVVLFAHGVIADASTGTAIEGIPIRDYRLEGPRSGVKGDEPPVVLLGDQGWLRDPWLPTLSPFRLSVTTFGRTEAQAVEMWSAVSVILHGLRNVLVDGVLLYQALDETGPQERDEPSTEWPTRFGVFDLYMADRILD